MKQAQDEIIKQLKDYPVVEAAKKHHGVHTLIYFSLAFICLISAYFVLFSAYFVLLGGGSTFAADNMQWWNYVLAMLLIIGMAYFAFKGLSVPLDINYDLKADRLKKLIDVAKYNPSVKSYFMTNTNLTNRDYYYLNIDEQHTVINNINGMAELKIALADEPVELTGDISKELGNVKIKPYISHKALMGKATKNIKHANLCVALFFVVIVVANVVTMPFTPLMRGIVLLLCMALFFTTIFKCFAANSIKAREQTYLSGEEYSAINKLCAYSPQVRSYISLVIQEERPLNERDWEALMVPRQLEQMEYLEIMYNQEPV